MLFDSDLGKMNMLFIAQVFKAGVLLFSSLFINDLKIPLSYF